MEEDVNVTNLHRNVTSHTSAHDPKADLTLPPRECLPQSHDGEAAKLEEARQQAEHKDGTEAWGTVVRRFISRLELPVTLTNRPTVTRSATLA
jgi:hypothetical protein